MFTSIGALYYIKVQQRYCRKLKRRNMRHIDLKMRNMKYKTYIKNEKCEAHITITVIDLLWRPFIPKEFDIKGIKIFMEKLLNI